MITPEQLEELWQRVTHYAPDCQVATPQPVLAEILCELRQWRRGPVTEEMLRRNDGYVHIGKGCLIVAERDWPNVADQRRESDERSLNIAAFG